VLKKRLMFLLVIPFVILITLFIRAMGSSNRTIEIDQSGVKEEYVKDDRVEIVTPDGRSVLFLISQDAQGKVTKKMLEELGEEYPNVKEIRIENVAEARGNIIVDFIKKIFRSS
jgi:hypothetical protein